MKGTAGSPGKPVRTSSFPGRRAVGGSWDRDFQFWGSEDPGCLVPRVPPLSSVTFAQWLGLRVSVLQFLPLL